MLAIPRAVALAEVLALVPALPPAVVAVPGTLAALLL